MADLRGLGRWLLAGTLALAVWAAPAPEAAATTLAPLTVEQMTDAADLIVRGRVVSQWVMTSPANTVITRTLVEVSRVYKGAIQPGEALAVDSPGGNYFGQIVDPGAAARFSEGEDVLLFLNRIYHGEGLTTVGMFLGKFSIRQNPLDGSEMPVRFTVPYARPFDARFIPHPPADERIRLDELEATVLHRVELGWDGQPIPGISQERLREINRLQPGAQ